MAGNYAQLLDIINNPTQHGLPAWDNNAKQIEGLTIKQYLLTIINSLTVGYQFIGMATPEIDPGTPDQNVFYLASTAGTYTNFNGLVLADGEIAILKYNGAWSKDSKWLALGQYSAKPLGTFIGVLRQGTKTNLSNTYGVCYLNIAQRGKANYIKAFTTKPAPENCVWHWRFESFSVDSGLTFGTPLVRTQELSDNNQFVFQNSELGYCVTIHCYNLTTGTYEQLSLSDFEGYEIYTINDIGMLSSVFNNLSDIKGAIESLNVADEIIYKQLMGFQFGLSVVEPTNGLIANTNAFVLDDGSHKVLRVIPGMELKIKIRSNFSAQVFWLKTYTIPTSDSLIPDFCPGHTTRESLNTGIYTVPNDCNFIAIGYMSGSTLIFPTEIELNGIDVLNPNIDDELSEEMLSRVLYGKFCNGFQAWIGSNGTYTEIGNTGVLSNVFPVFGGQSLRIVPQPDRSAQLFLCKTFTIPTTEGEIPDLCEGETGRRTITTDTTITLPDDCQFVVYGVKINNSDVAPGLYIDNVNLAIGLLASIKDVVGPVDAYDRNKDKTGRLLNASRKNIESDGSKDTQIILLGDQHRDSLAISNAIEIMNGFDSVDAMLNMGDCSNSFGDGFAATYISLLEKAIKPVYHTLGNHDVGYSPLVGVAGSNQQCYDQWIAPIIAKGWLQNGEYQTNKCYYYHDFAQGKTRLIVLYAYDDDNAFYTGYWEPVTYDSTKPNIVNGNSYVVGDIVNISNNNEYSFRCVNPVTVDGSTTTPTRPAYKFYRGINVIRQEQAQWFLDTLVSTPENYSVIVAIHGVPTEQFAIDHNKGGVFCQDLNKTAAQFGGYGMYDFIADAINAFVNGTVFNRTVTFKSYTGFDGISAKYAADYTVSKDFSVKNTGVQFHCWLCGHTHYDLVWKHNTYLQYCINPIGANTDYARNHVFNEGGKSATDICRTDTDGPAKDSLTVIAFNNSRSMKKVALAKVGVDVTIDAVKRDYAVLDLSD